MTPRQQRIAYLRDKREFYSRLGKRKRLIQIDAELVPLVTEEMKQENLVASIGADLEWIGGGMRIGEAA
jgi:hypothetical protein